MYLYFSVTGYVFQKKRTILTTREQQKFWNYEIYPSLPQHPPHFRPKIIKRPFRVIYVSPPATGTTETVLAEKKNNRTLQWIFYSTGAAYGRKERGAVRYRYIIKWVPDVIRISSSRRLLSWDCNLIPLPVSGRSCSTNFPVHFSQSSPNRSKGTVRWTVRGETRNSDSHGRNRYGARDSPECATSLIIDTGNGLLRRFPIVAFRGHYWFWRDDVRNSLGIWTGIW